MMTLAGTALTFCIKHYRSFICAYSRPAWKSLSEARKGTQFIFQNKMKLKNDLFGGLKLKMHTRSAPSSILGAFC